MEKLSNEAFVCYVNEYDARDDPLGPEVASVLSAYAHHIVPREGACEWPRFVQSALLVARMNTARELRAAKRKQK